MALNSSKPKTLTPAKKLAEVKVIKEAKIIKESKPIGKAIKIPNPWSTDDKFKDKVNVELTKVVQKLLTKHGYPAETMVYIAYAAEGIDSDGDECITGYKNCFRVNEDGIPNLSQAFILAKMLKRSFEILMSN